MTTLSKARQNALYADAVVNSFPPCCYLAVQY
jgi:hypothetical protein